MRRSEEWRETLIVRLVSFTWGAHIMVEPPVPLTALSEDQRAQAHTRFVVTQEVVETARQNLIIGPD